MHRDNSSWLVFLIKVLVACFIFYLMLQYLKTKPGFTDENGNVINATQHARMERVKSFTDSSDFVIDIPVRFKYAAKGGGFSVTNIGEVSVTAYNNLPEQTNSQPNIGASNRKVFEGSIALSRDIIEQYKVKYGDLACLTAKGKCYIVEDTMNKRYDNRNSPGSGWRADIFMYDHEEALKVRFKSDLMLIKQL